MNLFYFLLILGIIVFIHELGHLLSAKAFGVYCKEFSIGFGPKLFTFKGKETAYTLRLLPLGGFVSMAGELRPDDADIPLERTLAGAHPFKKIIVILSGVFFNFVLAYLIFVFSFMASGTVAVPADPVLIDVMKGSPADTAGLVAGDRILGLEFSNGHQVDVTNFDEISENISSVRTPITFLIQRDTETFEVTLTSYLDPESGKYLFGFIRDSQKVVRLKWYEAFGQGFSLLINVFTSIATTFGLMFQGRGVDQLSGPIGIYNVTADYVAAGPSAFVMLISLLSINVGMINLFPLPLLDGGRAVLIFIEDILKFKINPKVIDVAMQISIVILMFLIVLATSQDIIRLLT